MAGETGGGDESSRTEANSWVSSICHAGVVWGGAESARHNSSVGPEHPGHLSQCDSEVWLPDRMGHSKLVNRACPGCGMFWASALYMSIWLS